MWSQNHPCKDSIVKGACILFAKLCAGLIEVKWLSKIILDSGNLASLYEDSRKIIMTSSCLKIKTKYDTLVDK